MQPEGGSKPNWPHCAALSAAVLVLIELRLSQLWRSPQGDAFSSLQTQISDGFAHLGQRGPAGRFVAIDSNTYLSLATLKYSGLGTYDAGLGFISALATQVELSKLKPRLRDFTPRLVEDGHQDSRGGFNAVGGHQIERQIRC